MRGTKLNRTEQRIVHDVATHGFFSMGVLAEADDPSFLYSIGYMPKGRQPEDFGVADAVPRGLLGQLIYPFRRSARLSP